MSQHLYSIYDPTGHNYHYYVGSLPNVAIPEELPQFLPVQDILVTLPDGGRYTGSGERAEGILLTEGGLSFDKIQPEQHWRNHLFVQIALFVGGLIFWEGLRGR